MKIILLSLFLSLISLVGVAQDIKAIRITASDATNATFMLSKALTIHFENNLLLATDGTQTISFNLDGIKIEYLSKVTGIESIEAKAIFSIKDNMLFIQSLDKDQQAKVFSTSGQLLMTEYPKANDGIIYISFASLPKEICIIRCGNLSLKYKNK